MTQANSYLNQAASDFPNKIAIISNDNSLTYRQLYRHAQELLKLFKDLNIKNGDYVLVAIDNGLSYYIALCACLIYGAIIFNLPVDARDTEINSILDNEKFKLLIVDSKNLPSGINAYNDFVNDILEISFNNNELNFVIKKINQFLKFDSPNAKFGKDYVYRSMSSGSSGYRKHIIRDGAGINFMVTAVQDIYDMSANDVFLNFAPPSNHLSISVHLLALAYSATIISEKKFLAPLALKNIERHQVTVMFASPFIFDILSKNNNSRNIQSLRRAISVGAPLTEKIYRKFTNNFEIELHELYGAAETTITSGLIRNGQFISGLVGKPAPNSNIKILDDNFKEVGYNVVGNIAVKSEGTINFYLNLEDKNKFWQNYVLVGDRGYLNNNNELILCGRSNHVINVGGFKVDINEVEQVLMANNKISEAMVFDYNNEITSIVAAAVVLQEKISHEEIINWCSKNLSPIKIPKKIFFIDSLPRDNVGKLDRRAIYNLINDK